MNGKGLIIAILSVGVALGGLMLRGFAGIDTEIAAMREDIGDLRERMARLEGRVDTLIEMSSPRDPQ